MKLWSVAFKHIREIVLQFLFLSLPWLLCSVLLFSFEFVLLLLLFGFSIDFVEFFLSHIRYCVILFLILL